jgi:hypothetical protein
MGEGSGREREGRGEKGREEKTPAIVQHTPSFEILYKSLILVV